MTKWWQWEEKESPLTGRNTQCILRAELSSCYVQKSQSDHGEQRSPGATCKVILLSCCCLTSASVTHLHLYISVVSMNTHSNILATCSYSVLFYTLPGSFRSPPRPNMRFWGVESRSTWRNHTLSARTCKLHKSPPRVQTRNLLLHTAPCHTTVITFVLHRSRWTAFRLVYASYLDALISMQLTWLGVLYCED